MSALATISAQVQQTSTKALIMGDFNVNLLNTNPMAARLSQLMQAAGFTAMLSEPSTDHLTCIDHIWGKGIDGRTGTTEAYWSDHDITWRALD